MIKIAGGPTLPDQPQQQQQTVIPYTPPPTPWFENPAIVVPISVALLGTISAIAVAIIHNRRKGK